MLVDCLKMEKPTEWPVWTRWIAVNRWGIWMAFENEPHAEGIFWKCPGKRESIRFSGHTDEANYTNWQLTKKRV